MSLHYFYEEVGSINFIGLFPLNMRSDGCDLDPLYIDSVEMALQMVNSLKHCELGDLWAEDPMLMLAPDRFHKYGYSGGGAYTLRLPSDAIDEILLNEPHGTTLINYLRICMRWGGFPGSEQKCSISSEELEYLTKDLIPI